MSSLFGWHKVVILVLMEYHISHFQFTDVTLQPASLVPNGFVVSWYDDFNGNQINESNWVVGRYQNSSCYIPTG